MALQYSGHGDKFGITVAIYGDGSSKAVTIDVSKSPFSIDFGPVGSRPSLAFITNVTDNADASVSLSGINLTIGFTAAPPAVSFNPPNPGLGRRELYLRFIYG